MMKTSPRPNYRKKKKSHSQTSSRILGTISILQLSHIFINLDETNIKHGFGEGEKNHKEQVVEWCVTKVQVMNLHTLEQTLEHLYAQKQQKEQQTDCYPVELQPPLHFVFRGSLVLNFLWDLPGLGKAVSKNQNSGEVSSSFSSYKC